MISLAFYFENINFLRPGNACAWSNTNPICLFHHHYCLDYLHFKPSTVAGRGKRSKVPFDVKKGTRGSPRLRKPMGLLSIPLEIRQMILTPCIKSKWKEGDDDSGEPGGYGDAHWQLSHTIPQSLLQVSHQIREEAFHALATYPFTVVRNVWCSGEVEGRIQDPEEFHARPTIQAIGLDYHPEHARVHKQMKNSHPKPQSFAFYFTQMMTIGLSRIWRHVGGVLLMMYFWQ